MIKFISFLAETIKTQTCCRHLYIRLKPINFTINFSVSLCCCCFCVRRTLYIFCCTFVAFFSHFSVCIYNKHSFCCCYCCQIYTHTKRLISFALNVFVDYFKRAFIVLLKRLIYMKNKFVILKRTKILSIIFL